MKKRTVENDTLVITDETGKASLSIKELFEDQEARFLLGGRITAELAHDFEDELTLAAGVCSRILLDFSEVESIASGGLKALLAVQQKLDQKPEGRLLLKAVSGDVLKTFQELGFSELFEMEK